MYQDFFSEHPLFGGEIASTFPNRFQDVSNIRQVPDHQEVFVDPARDESVIFELLDLKHDVGANGSATWFLQDLATEQEAEGSMIYYVAEQSGVIEAPTLCYRSIPAVVTTAVGQMSLGGREVHTNSPLSESANAVGAGFAVPATQSGCMPIAEVFKLAVSSFKVND